MTTIDLDRPSATSAQFSRKAAVTGWISEAEDLTPFQVAQHNFVEWSRVLGNFDKLASENFYQKPNFTMLDVRQHSAALHQIIGQGEMIAAQFIVLNEPKAVESYVSFIDEQLKRLNEVLSDWHGPPDMHADTPESFQEAMREYAEGKTVELEEDVSHVDVPREDHISA